MAERKKGGEKSPDQSKRGAERNDFTADEIQEYWDSLEEIVERAAADAAAARGDMNAVYDKMCENLGITKEIAKFQWAKRIAEKRFEARAKKMDAKDRECLIRTADALGDDAEGFGAWLRKRADAIDVKATTKATKKKGEAAEAEGEKEPA